MNLQPTLQNDLVVLKPLKADDFEALYAVASDPLIWAQHPASNRYQRPIFEAFFKDAMDSKGAFLVLDKKTDKVIGSSRYNGFDATTKTIEIGWTFLAKEYWGGQYNQAMKALMMNHAFTFVENILFVIGENNIRSQKAVEKIGGKRIAEDEYPLLQTKSVGSVIYKVKKT